MFSMLPLRIAVVPVSAAFLKSLFSRSPQRLFRNKSFYLLYNLKRTNFP